MEEVVTIETAAGPARLLPASKYRRHNSRATAVVEYGDHQQGAFIRGVRNQIISYPSEPQRSGGQFGAPVPLMGKRHKLSDGAQDFFADASGSRRIILGNEFPNVKDVLRRL